MITAKHAQAAGEGHAMKLQRKLLLDFSWLQEINCFPSETLENESLVAARRDA